eukprot:483287_1
MPIQPYKNNDMNMNDDEFALNENINNKSNASQFNKKNKNNKNSKNNKNNKNSKNNKNNKNSKNNKNKRRGNHTIDPSEPPMKKVKYTISKKFLNEKNIYQIRDICKKEGVTTNGRKNELIEKLITGTKKIKRKQRKLTMDQLSQKEIEKIVKDMKKDKVKNFWYSKSYGENYIKNNGLKANYTKKCHLKQWLIRRKISENQKKKKVENDNV